jgi:NAD(P)H-dependent flavin oxidoreductase YrpB (nitropropane dioxygenase family)
MNDPIHTPLCEILGIRHPIIQTAMGWIATPEMVASCCNAGAIGFLATATVKAEEVDALISRVEELTDRPFGVNFLMEAPGADLIVDTIVRHRVKAASYARSPNPEYIKRFKEAGILCIPTCGAVRHSQKAVQLGADVVIVQGGEGGGHTGSVPTSILVPQVVDAIDVPVVAAGGFHDGRGLVAALAFGATGIAMGTRFLLSAVHRLESSGRLSLMLRALRSALQYRKLSDASLIELIRSALAMKSGEKMTRSQMLMAANAPILVRKAMIEGDPVGGVLPSGTVAGVIGDRPGCGELIERIISEAERTLEALAS